MKKFKGNTAILLSGICISILLASIILIVMTFLTSLRIHSRLELIQNTFTANFAQMGQVIQTYVIIDQKLETQDIQFEDLLNTQKQKAPATDIKYAVFIRDKNSVLHKVTAGINISTQTEKEVVKIPNGTYITLLEGKYLVLQNNTNTKAIFLIFSKDFLLNNLNWNRYDHFYFRVKSDSVLDMKNAVLEHNLNSYSILDIFTNSGTYSFKLENQTWKVFYTLHPDLIYWYQFFAAFFIFTVGIVITILFYRSSVRFKVSQKQATRLEQQKDEFVAIASHELKTPLTSIKALTQILDMRLEEEKNPLYQSFFRKINTQIHRMETLINDLLDVSRIRSGKLTYAMVPLDIGNMVTMISDDIDTISRTHRVSVIGKIKGLILGDKERITQVIVNILNNAAKYSPMSNLILVQLSETNTEITIAVQDFGIGIPQAEQKRIFERFYRVETEENKYKGLGIGLFISSEIIRKHKGKLRVKSTEGKGSIFSLTFPRHFVKTVPKKAKST